jgi:hypothetical protein
MKAPQQPADTHFPLSEDEYHMQVYAAIPLSLIPTILLLAYQQWTLAACFLVGVGLFQPRLGLALKMAPYFAPSHSIWQVVQSS